MRDWRILRPLSLLLGLLLAACSGGLPGDVAGLLPAAGATAVSARAPLRITFDAPVGDPDAYSWSVRPAHGGVVRWPDEQTAVFTPLLPWQAQTTYEVTVERPLGAIRWSFTTGAPTILYLAEDGAGRPQLWRTTSDGDGAQLSDAEFGVNEYAISPDGNTILFSAGRAGGGADLWSVPRAGGELTHVLDCAGQQCRRPAWHPDQALVVFERRLSDAGTPRLWWLELDSGATAAAYADPESAGAWPQVSPDGAWLSFHDPAAELIRVLNLESGRLYAIPSRTGEPGAWHPRGDYYVTPSVEFTHEGAAVHLVRLHLAGGGLTDISGEQQTDDGMPAWSPDGEQIAFARRVPRTPLGRQLVVMGADGSIPRRLTADAEIQHSRPQWSPDGRWLVYERFQLNGGAPAVWLIDVAGGAEREVVPAGWAPQWLP